MIDCATEGTQLNNASCRTRFTLGDQVTREDQTKRLLLISNSTLHGSGYLDHAEAEIRDSLRSSKGVLFVPFALHDRDAYAAQARERFEAMGYGFDSVHEVADAKSAINRAEAIFVG